MPNYTFRTDDDITALSGLNERFVGFKHLLPGGRFADIVTDYRCMWVPRRWSSTCMIISIRTTLIVWVISGIAIGCAVGGYLSYVFNRGSQVDGGTRSESTKLNSRRDEHWLESFVFGAVIYFIILLPNSLDLGVFLVIVGALVGVVAAAANHFSPRSWKESPVVMIAIALLGGTVGLGSSFLFFAYAGQFVFANLHLAPLAGALTFVVPFLRERIFTNPEQHQYV